MLSLRKMRLVGRTGMVRAWTCSTATIGINIINTNDINILHNLEEVHPAAAEEESLLS